MKHLHWYVARPYCNVVSWIKLHILTPGGVSLHLARFYEALISLSVRMYVAVLMYTFGNYHRSFAIATDTVALPYCNVCGWNELSFDTWECSSTRSEILWGCNFEDDMSVGAYLEDILLKGPYPPCLRMADRALLAGYPRSAVQFVSEIRWHLRTIDAEVSLTQDEACCLDPRKLRCHETHFGVCVCVFVLAIYIEAKFISWYMIVFQNCFSS